MLVMEYFSNWDIRSPALFMYWPLLSVPMNDINNFVSHDVAVVLVGIEHTPTAQLGSELVEPEDAVNVTSLQLSPVQSKQSLSLS